MSEITDSKIVETTTEEYAYLDKGGFSSELFKIEIRGLPKYYGIAELKKLINDKLNLNSSKIKRPKLQSHWIYACFRNDMDRAKAVEALNGYSWKGKILNAEVAKPAPDPLVRKRKQYNSTESNNKISKTGESRSQEERLKDATTPYWIIPYNEQLKMKEKEIRRLLQKLDNDVWFISKERRPYIEEKRKQFNGLTLPIDPIERSPVLEGYRNKCEFTVGIDEETKLTTVGFRLGSYVMGTVAVAPVSSLIHVSEETKKAVLLFEKFVREMGLPPFSPADFSGYWNCLTVRHSRMTGEIMLIVAMHPQDLSSDAIKDIKNKLIEYFSSEESKACNIKSVYFELVLKKKSGEQSEAEHLMGSTHITDSILGKQFRISPQAFFQINTAGADILYKKAIEMSAPTKHSTVVDICCGTGTIGLCFAEHCNKVLGLEIVDQAVKDAKANAVTNNVSNCEFFTGKAEDILNSVLARVTDQDVIAIVDPPRAGLHMRAVTQLRNSKKVKRLVYISCSPAAAVKNFVDLCRQPSKTLHGAPFVPVRAVPVDMFPHTKHVELAMLFERTVEDETSSESKEQNNEISKVNIDNTDVTKDNTDVNLDNADVTVDNADVTVDNADVTADNTHATIDNTHVTIDNTDVNTDANDINTDVNDVNTDKNDVNTVKNDVNTVNNDVNTDNNDVNNKLT